MDSIYIVILIAVTFIIAILTYYQFKKPSNKKRTDNVYMEALNAMLLSDKKKAINLLTTLVKNNSEHINAYLQLGNLLRGEDTDRAIKIHQMLTVRQKIDKNTKIEILKSLALDYEYSNDLIKAKTEVEKIIDIDKSNMWANSFLLSLAERMQDWSYAEKKAKDLLKIKGFKGEINLAKYTLQRGRMQFEEGNINEAESLLRKAINDSPEFGLSYKFLGDIMHSKRDLVKAVKYWEKYMELSPSGSYEVFDSIETALFDLGRYSEVEKFYRDVLEKNPNDFNAGQRLANVLNEKGENKAAIELIERFLDDDNPSLLVMLMKLKLSLTTKTPAEFGYFIDEVLKNVKLDKD